MITTVTPSHTIPIPDDISRKFGIQPGWRLDWSPIEGRDEILVRVIPGRGELARRLLWAGQRFSPERGSKEIARGNKDISQTFRKPFHVPTGKCERRLKMRENRKQHES